MTDVFISYAGKDREHARTLASALGAQGWSVWWDRKIIAGQAFDQVIEHELETAKSVVVLWSRESVSSEWVKTEAADAVERGVLVPALIERVKLPLEFRRKQTVDLIGWDGNPAHAGFQALCEGIANAMGIAVQRHSSEREAQLRRNRYWTYGAIATIATVLAVAAYFVRPLADVTAPTTPPPPAVATEPSTSVMVPETSPTPVILSQTSEAAPATGTPAPAASGIEPELSPTPIVQPRTLEEAAPEADAQSQEVEPRAPSGSPNLDSEELRAAIRGSVDSAVVGQVPVDGQTQSTYVWSVWLDLPSEQTIQIARVEYYFNHSSFRNPKHGNLDGSRFRVEWIGWGCVTSARVVVYFRDSSKVEAPFNLCEVVEWQ